MNPAKRVLALCVAVLLAGSVAACSKSEDTAATTTTAKASSDKSTTTEKDSGDSTDSGDSSTGDFDMGNLEECMAVSTAWLSIVGAPLAALGGQMTEADIEEFNAQLEELESQVPDDIKGDMAIVGEAYAEYFQAMGELMQEGDLLTNADKLEELGEKIESPEVSEAEANIEAYLDETCGG